MKSFKNQQGITLVALIITIIVLIILAAVTIISVNNMGLVPLAINGTQNYAIAQETEGSLVNGITDLVLGAISNIENSRTGAGGSSSNEPKGDATLTVTIAVDKANVTGEKIPVTVTSVKNGEQEVESGLTYIYYLEEEKKGTGSKAYTFEGLDETKSYTMKVQAVESDGTWGEAEVKVLSFSVEGVDEAKTVSYYRCTDGMTFDDWGYSAYPKKNPAGTDGPFCADPDLGYGWGYQVEGDFGVRFTGYHIYQRGKQSPVYYSDVIIERWGLLY